MELEGSLQHSQVPATCHYPEPARTSPYPIFYFLKIILNIILPFTPGSPKWSLVFCQCFKILYHNIRCQLLRNIFTFNPHRLRTLLLHHAQCCFCNVSLACEVTGSHAIWLLPVDMWRAGLQANNADKRTLAANHAVCWPHKNKLFRKNADSPLDT